MFGVESRGVRFYGQREAMATAVRQATSTTDNSIQTSRSALTLSACMYDENRARNTKNCLFRTASHAWPRVGCKRTAAWEVIGSQLLYLEVGTVVGSREDEHCDRESARVERNDR